MQNRLRTCSVFGDDRAAPAIVHAHANQLFLSLPAVVNLEGRVRRDWIGGDRFVSEVHVQIFQLGAPVCRKRPLGTCASCPADFCFAESSRVLDRSAGPEIRLSRIADIAVGKTAGCVQQETVGNSETGTSADRAKPIQPFMGRKESCARERRAVCLNDRSLRGGAADVSTLNVSFEAEYKAARLPIVTNLPAA